MASRAEIERYFKGYQIKGEGIIFRFKIEKKDPSGRPWIGFTPYVYTQTQAGKLTDLFVKHGAKPYEDSLVVLDSK